MEKKTENIRISLTDSIILMLVIIAEIVFCVRGGLNLAVPLLLTWLIIFLYCKIRKLPWDVVEGYALQGVRDGFQSVCIVAAVGCLIGTWILGGTIPTMIYYGLKLPHRYPLPASGGKNVKWAAINDYGGSSGTETRPLQ